MTKKIVTLAIIAMICSIAILPAVNSLEASKTQSNSITTCNSGGVEYYAVLAACASYKNPAYNLPIAEFKMKKLYRGLISNDNWKPENIILLVNNNPDLSNPGYTGGATKANIIKALEEMAGKVGKDDVFLFSWQGHGSEVHESETSGPNDDYETDRYDEVICPWDCDRDNNGKLVNYLTDDDLDYYFDNIKADGMMLIFESCFSGALVANTLGDKLFGNDVDQLGRVVVVSTFDGSLGRASWIYGFPMTWTIGDAFDQNSLLGGPAAEDYITAEDAFNWARPKIFLKNSIIWLGIWTYFFVVEYEFQRDENGLDPEAAFKAALNAAMWTFYEFCLVQLQAILAGGTIMLNWPHMIDKYNPLFGGKELVIVDNVGLTNNGKLDIPTMPNIWEKPAYEVFSDDFKNDVTEAEYDEISWYNWQEIDKETWPTLQAKADYQVSVTSTSIDFNGEAINGPPDYTYQWDFGDGETSTEQNPNHLYSNTGKYTVTLDVTDSEGRSANTIIDNVKIQNRVRTRNIFDILTSRNNFIKLFFQLLKI